MSIRRAIPIAVTDDPVASREFYERFLGFDVVMDEVVYPLTDEPWGIRRFFVREPSRTVVNVASLIADLE